MLPRTIKVNVKKKNNPNRSTYHEKINGLQELRKVKNKLNKKHVIYPEGGGAEYVITLQLRVLTSSFYRRSAY